MQKQTSLFDDPQSNPLFEPQREKSGAQTFEKYMYQYHWALYRILEEQENGKEYAVFVELHEDVVVANSLDRNKAKFEFNQVKTNQASFTVSGLTQVEKPKITKGKKGKPKSAKPKVSSVLGKLLDSCQNKAFSKEIGRICLVATSGFSLELKKAGTSLEKIKISDLSDACVDSIKAALKKELSSDHLPDTLEFVVPDLPARGFQNSVIGSISVLINRQFPSSHYNSDDIYRVLMDELNRKGTITYDYNEWDDLIKRKALTSTTVTKVIEQFTSRKGDEKIYSTFEEIATELGYTTYLKKRNLKSAFERYYLQRLGSKSLNNLEVAKEISNLLIKLENKCYNVSELIKNVSDKLSKRTKNQLKDELDLKGAIICELILLD